MHKTKKSTLALALVFPICLMLIGGILLFTSGKPLMDKNSKRIPVVSSVDEAEHAYQNNQKLVEMEIPALQYTSYAVETVKTENNVEKSRKTTSFFMYTMMDDGFMVVELPYNQLGNPVLLDRNITLAGRLVQPSSDIYSILHNITIEISEIEGLDYQSMKQHVSYVYLDTGVFESMAILFFTGAGIFLLGIILGIVLVLRLKKKNS